jgi:hypothetical protein
MKHLTSLSLLFGFLCTSTLAYAEGGTCPDGYYPSNGPGVMGCSPIPGYNTQQQQTPEPPPPQWESRWGAITVGKPGIFGSSANISNQQSANQSALADCRAKGGAECQIEDSWANGCGVLIAGNPGYNVTVAATLEEATQHGLKVCRDAGATNCRVHHSTCSPSVRIR